MNARHRVGELGTFAKLGTLTVYGKHCKLGGVLVSETTPSITHCLDEISSHETEHEIVEDYGGNV